jgi:hypothetical protein
VTVKAGPKTTDSEIRYIQESSTEAAEAVSTEGASAEAVPAEAAFVEATKSNKRQGISRNRRGTENSGCSERDSKPA